MDFELNLIKLIREHDYLYDSSQEEYKNMVIKDKGWQMISQLLSVDESLCRKKWKSLRDQFLRELKRNGTPQRHRWKYFDELLFLKEFCGKSVINKHKTVIKSERVDLPVTTTETLAIPLGSEIKGEYAASSDEVSASFSPAPHGSVATRRKRAIENVTTTAIDEDEDEVDAFFKSTAKMVKSIKFTHKELINLQIDILSVIRSKMK